MFCDSRSAVISCRKETTAEISRKSRHLAIKLSAVGDHAERIAFCPTSQMRADCLTKGGPNPEIFRLIFTAAADTRVKNNIDSDNTIPDYQAYAIDVVTKTILASHLAIY